MRILRKESEQSPKYRLLGLVEHLSRRGMLFDTLVSAFEDAVLNLIDTLLRKVSNVYLIHILAYNIINWNAASSLETMSDMTYMT